MYSTKMRSNRSRKKKTRRKKNRRTYKKKSYRRTYKKRSYRKGKNLKRKSLKGGAVGIEVTIPIKQTFKDGESLLPGTIIYTDLYGGGTYKRWDFFKKHIIVFDSDWIDGNPPTGLHAGGPGGPTERHVTKTELENGGRTIHVHQKPKTVQVYFEVNNNRLVITSEDMDDIKALEEGLYIDFPGRISQDPEVKNKNITRIDSQLFTKGVQNGNVLTIDLAT